MDGTVRRLWWILTGPVLAVAVTALSLWLTFDDPDNRPPPTLADVELTLLLGLPLAARRRAPIPVLIVVALAVCGMAATRHQMDIDQLAVLLAAAAAIRRTRGWPALGSAALAGSALVVAIAEDEVRSGGASDFLWIPVAVFCAFAVGVILRDWDRRRRTDWRVAPPSARAVAAVAIAAVTVAVAHVPLDRAIYGPPSLDGVRWRHSLSNGIIETVAVATDGDVLALSRIGSKAVLTRYGPEGQRRWRRTLADVVPDTDGGDLAPSADGGAVVAVTRTDPIATGLETDITTGLVVRLDDDGETEWETLLAGPVTGVFDVAAGPNGEVAVVGQRPSPDEASPMPGFIETFRADGSTGWDGVIAADGPAGAFAVAYSPDSRVHVGGARNSGSNADAFVRTYEPDGALGDDDTIDVSGADIVSDLVPDASGGLITVVQSATSFTSTQAVISTIRSTDDEGQLRWSKQVRSEATTAESAAVNADGDVVVVGNRPRRLWEQDLNLDLGVYRWDREGRRRSTSRVGTKADETLRSGAFTLAPDGDLVLAYHRNPGSGDGSSTVLVRMAPPWA